MCFKDLLNKRGEMTIEKSVLKNTVKKQTSHSIA